MYSTSIPKEGPECAKPSNVHFTSTATIFLSCITQKTRGMCKYYAYQTTYLLMEIIPTYILLYFELRVRYDWWAAASNFLWHTSHSRLETCLASHTIIGVILGVASIVRPHPDYWVRYGLQKGTTIIWKMFIVRIFSWGRQTTKIKWISICVQRIFCAFNFRGLHNQRKHLNTKNFTHKRLMWKFVKLR